MINSISHRPLFADWFYQELGNVQFIELRHRLLDFVSKAETCEKTIYLLVWCYILFVGIFSTKLLSNLSLFINKSI